MQELKSKAQALIDTYNLALAPFGVHVDLSKHYFESSVNIPSTNIDRRFYKKREKKYNWERNRYHCLVLTLLPLDRSRLPRRYCKEYAFLLRTTERLHYGLQPKHKKYTEDFVLHKIEKRLQEIVNKAKRTTLERLCKDTLWDVPRYFHTKYQYKRKILGKSILFWDITFAVFICILALLFYILIGLLSR